MYTNCKYVVMETPEGQNMYLFPARVIHRSVSTNMKGKAVSAGFVILVDGEFFCRGRSDSLQLKSRECDVDLLRDMIT
jgi:hypothetical protein